MWDSTIGICIKDLEGENAIFLLNLWPRGGEGQTERA